jgi:signal peptidase II
VTRGAAWTRAGLVVAVVLVIDQVSKALVRHNIVPGERDEVLPFLDLVNTRNEGIAFGGLGGSPIVIALVIAALIGIIVVFAMNATRRWAWLSAGLLLGGAIGNIIDRLREGAVTDFLKLPHWPQFNVADIAVTLGVLSLFFVLGDERDDR